MAARKTPPDRNTAKFLAIWYRRRGQPLDITRIKQRWETPITINELMLRGVLSKVMRDDKITQRGLISQRH